MGYFAIVLGLACLALTLGAPPNPDEAATTESLQSKLTNLWNAVRTGDFAKILPSVKAVWDSINIFGDIGTVLNNYESHMWDASFRQQLGEIIKGMSKAFSSGIGCFSQGMRGTLNNVTTSFVAAMDKAFIADSPNSTTPASTGVAAAGEALLDSMKVVGSMFSRPEFQQVFVGWFQGICSSFQAALKCVQANTTDITKSWEKLTKQLTATTATTAPTA